MIMFMEKIFTFENFKARKFRIVFGKRRYTHQIKLPQKQFIVTLTKITLSITYTFFQEVEKLATEINPFLYLYPI